MIQKMIIFLLMAIVEYFIILAITNIIKKSNDYIGVNYSILSFTYQDNELCGLNILIHILFPTFYIVVVSGILYNMKCNQIVENIYLVTLFFYIIRIVNIIVILRRKYLQNWKFEIITSLAGFILSLFIYKIFIIKTTEIFIPIDELRNDIWFAIIAFVFIIIRDNIYNYSNIDNVKSQIRKEKYIIEKYYKFKIKYSSIINNENTEINNLTYAIMIFEDFNRPPFYRIFEYLKLFVTKTATLGVMQVRTSKFISNQDSVRLGYKKICKNYNKCLKADKENYLRNVILKYNDSTTYADEVIAILEMINNIK